MPEQKMSAPFAVVLALTVGASQRRLPASFELDASAAATGPVPKASHADGAVLEGQR
jgi:hypothetical protein